MIIDSYLAKLYQCTNGTKNINKAVKRNINRFPKDFYMQLTDEKMDKLSLRSQFVTLNKSNNMREPKKFKVEKFGLRN